MYDEEYSIFKYPCNIQSCFLLSNENASFTSYFPKHSSRSVITAAHCVVDKDTCHIFKDNTDQSLKIISGLYAYNQSERDILRRSKAKEWTSHQKYCPEMDPSMFPYSWK